MFLHPISSTDVVSPFETRDMRAFDQVNFHYPKIDYTTDYFAEGSLYDQPVKKRGVVHGFIHKGFSSVLYDLALLTGRIALIVLASLACIFLSPFRLIADNLLQANRWMCREFVILVLGHETMENFTRRGVAVGIASLAYQFFGTLIQLPYKIPQFALQRTFMFLTFPLQSTLVKTVSSLFYYVTMQGGIYGRLETARTNFREMIHDAGGEVRHVRFDKDGIVYDGLMAVHPEGLRTGNWIIQSVGNTYIEDCGGIARKYIEKGCNVLMLNPPGVGLSEGLSTPETLGASVEVGMQFLEEHAKPKHITVAGYSIGGAAVAKAVEMHPFKDGINYHIMHQMTVSSIGDTIVEFVNRLSLNLLPDVIQQAWKVVIAWSGAEIDLTETARRIRVLPATARVSYDVMQSAHYRDMEIVARQPADIRDDGVVSPDTALAKVLIERGSHDRRMRYYYLKNASHRSPVCSNLTADILEHRR